LGLGFVWAKPTQTIGQSAHFGIFLY